LCAFTGNLLANRECFRRAKDGAVGRRVLVTSTKRQRLLAKRRPRFLTRPVSIPYTACTRAFPPVRFVYLSVERPSNKIYGINCPPELGAKLLDRFFHRRRQISPPVSNATHRFFDGSQHFLYCNFTVGPRHSAVASSSST